MSSVSHQLQLTVAQRIVIRSATLSPPSAWVISPTGGRTGFEAVAWKKNIQRLIGHDLMYANGHGDFTLTVAGEKLREKLIAEGVPS